MTRTIPAPQLEGAEMNSLVRCNVCLREERVDFGTCLRSGWPKCHGYTMTLVSTTADIDKAVGGVVQEAGGALMPLLRR